MVVLAAARALRQFPPLANASLVDEEIVYHSYINVGIAVALAKGGLIVPVVKTPIKKPCTPWDWKSVLWPPELGKTSFLPKTSPVAPLPLLI